jgi:hypothetical protein
MSFSDEPQGETLSDAEIDARKRAIFDTMSPRNQRRIRKKGYDTWDPFILPKDPIDIRRDKTKRTTQQLVREFLHQCSHESYSNEYGRGVLDVALGIINGDDRYRGIFDFCIWYRSLLKKEKRSF